MATIGPMQGHRAVITGFRTAKPDCVARRELAHESIAAQRSRR